jgi:excisionase family DNA binding protein
MRTSMPNAGRPAYYTVHQAAAILGVEPSHISRAIRLRTLRAVRQRGRLLVPASALTALLGTPVNDSQPSGGTP